MISKAGHQKYMTTLFRIGARLLFQKCLAIKTYITMSPEERWKKWGLIGTYDTWEELNKLVKEYE